MTEYLELILLCFLSGVASGNMDRLKDFRETIVYQRWNNPISRFMLRGSDGRAWIPKWLPLPVRSFIRLLNDGMHVSKAVMLGALLWLAADTWLQFAAGYLAIGGGFYLMYHIVLPGEH